MWVHRLIQTPPIAPQTVASACLNRQCIHSGRKQVSVHASTTIVGRKQDKGCMQRGFRHAAVASQPLVASLAASCLRQIRGKMASGK